MFSSYGCSRNDYNQLLGLGVRKLIGARETAACISCEKKLPNGTISSSKLTLISDRGTDFSPFVQKITEICGEMGIITTKAA